MERFGGADTRRELSLSARDALVDMLDHFGHDDAVHGAYADVLIGAARTFARKHHDYGRKNIAGSGQIGVLVRMNDKVQRMLNLRGRAASVADESLLDSAQDVANYALILEMLLTGRWPGQNMAWSLEKTDKAP